MPGVPTVINLCKGTPPSKSNEADHTSIGEIKQLNHTDPAEVTQSIFAIDLLNKCRNMSRLDYFTPEHTVKESLSSRVLYRLRLQKEELQTLDSSKVSVNNNTVSCVDFLSPNTC